MFNSVKLFFHGFKTHLFNRVYFVSYDYSKHGEYALKQFGYNDRNGKAHIIKTEYVR